MAPSNKKDKKKKGPKGKKGRAKAKRENHWGMKIDENDTKPKRRKIKSRILSQQEQGIDFDNQDDKMRNAGKKFKKNYDSDDSSSSDDMDDLIGGAMNQVSAISYKNLLDRIVDNDEDNEQEIDDDNSSASSSNSSENDSDNAIETDEDDSSTSEASNQDDSNQIDEETLEETLKETFLNHFINKKTFDDENELNNLIKKLHAQNNLTQIDLNKNMQIYCSPDSDTKKKKMCNNKIAPNWKGLNEKETPLQNSVYQSLSSYSDVLCTTETLDNRNEIYNVIIYHLIQHIITSNKIIIENDKKIQECEEKKKEDQQEKKSKKRPKTMNVDDDDMDCRDQGYTKPKVLVLLPTRGTCHIFLSKLIQCLGDVNARNLDRFHEEYGPEEMEETTDKLKKIKQFKGKDWNYFFGDEVNHDDDFRIGISITPPSITDDTYTSKKKKKLKQTTVHLYSDFYRSDLIIASPLSMKMTTTENEEQDIDFLSSVDVCVIGHSDVLLMQNWDHVIATLENMNQLPKKSNDTDFSRVRDYFLAEQGCFWRQLIVVSFFNGFYIFADVLFRYRDLMIRIYYQHLNEMLKVYKGK